MVPLSEQAIQQRIRLELSRGPVRLWRNNTGALRDARGQLIRFGLCEGSSDLIGYRTVTITPDMVGQRLAVFTAVEVKTATGRLTPQQQTFIDHVRAAGGVAGVARTVGDAAALLRFGSSPAAVAFTDDDHTAATPTTEHPAPRTRSKPSGVNAQLLAAAE